MECVHIPFASLSVTRREIVLDARAGDEGDYGLDDQRSLSGITLPWMSLRVPSHTAFPCTDPVYAEPLFSTLVISAVGCSLL